MPVRRLDGLTSNIIQLTTHALEEGWVDIEALVRADLAWQLARAIDKSFMLAQTGDLKWKT
jgi:hypothetical protein